MSWTAAAAHSSLVLVHYVIPFADPHLKPLRLTDQVVSSRWVRTVRWMTENPLLCLRIG